MMNISTLHCKEEEGAACFDICNLLDLFVAQMTMKNGSPVSNGDVK